MKWIKRILISLLILIAVVIISAYLWLNSSKPQYTGTLKIAGITGKVDAYFDDYGIPHIYAENKHDLYISFGYLHAQDRLFQMEMLRRAGSGQLAEIIGRPLLKVDRMFRSLGLTEYAKESAAYMETQKGTPMYNDIMAYLEGINTYITHGETPPEFSIIGIEKKPFSLEDLYYITGAMSFSFSQAQRTEPVIDFVQKKYGDKYLEDLGLWHDPNESFIRTTNHDSSRQPIEPIEEKNENENENEEEPIIGTHKRPDNEKDIPLMMAEAMNEIERLLPIAPLEGSNSWVVSGKKTESGNVIFCNDTHIGYLLPQTWYEAHLSCPDFEMYGHFMAGVPFALIGRNRNLSWGVTMLLNDDMDFYYEKNDPADENKFLSNNQYVACTTIPHIIKIKGEADTTIQVRFTKHGPIINDAFDGMGHEQPISMYWTYTKLPNRTVDAFYGMNNSTDFEAFKKNLPMLHAPGLNINYGDKSGNIAWWGCASLIKRPEGTNSWTILDGTTGKDDPLGFYPFSVNARTINPSWGYIYSANDWPQELETFTTADQELYTERINAFKHSADSGAVVNAPGIQYEDTVLTDLLHSFTLKERSKIWYPGYYKPQYRADRIRYLLEQKNDWTLDAMKSVMTDHTNPADTALLHRWAEELETVPEFLNTVDFEQYYFLFGWNGEYSLNEPGPTFFNKMLYHYMHFAMADEIGEDRFALFLQTHQVQRTQTHLYAQKNSPWWDRKGTIELETRADITYMAFVASIEDLKEQFGTNPKIWNWRKAATLELRHPLGEVAIFRPFFNVGPHEVYGGNESILQAGYLLDSTGVYKVFYGSQMRIMVDFVNVDSSLNVTPCGNSGHVLSAHYKDQADLYRTMKFRPQWMGEQRIRQFERLEIIGE